MSPYLRKVKTASGATAVQIVEKKHGQRTILEHVGSARDETELAALLQAGRDKLHANQPMLDLAAGPRSAAVALVEGSRSQLLIDVVRGSWERLGFDTIADAAFFQLVLARLVEPTSKLDSLRVLAELGMPVPHRNTFTNALKRCAANEYRDRIAQACFQHVWNGAGGDVSLRRHHALFRDRHRGRASQGRLLERAPGRSPNRGRPVGGPVRVPAGDRLLRGQ